MNKTFATKYDDVIASQLANKNLIDIDFAYMSINVISTDTGNQYTPSSEQIFPYADQHDAINNDERIPLHNQSGWSNFDMHGIGNEGIAKSFAVLVTDLTSTLNINKFSGKTSPITIRRVDN